ncbi:MAG TPA: hypothetical protein VGL86_21255 [Polyangia bacterium]
MNTPIRTGLLLMLALVAGCGDDTTMPTTQDLATSADLAAPADLELFSCASILACVHGCGQNLVCQVGCTQDGTTAARSTFNAFTSCVAAICGPGDGGSDGCTSPTDNGAACQTCLSTAAADALNPGAPCNTEYLACAAS